MLTRYCTEYKITPTRISLKISIVQDVKNRREWSLEQHVQHKGHRIDCHHQAGVDDCLHAKKKTTRYVTLVLFGLIHKSLKLTNKLSDTCTL